MGFLLRHMENVQIAFHLLVIERRRGDHPGAFGRGNDAVLAASYRSNKRIFLFVLIRTFHRREPPHIVFFMRFSAAFSSLDTCACDMPISSATSICVRPW